MTTNYPDPIDPASAPQQPEGSPAKERAQQAAGTAADEAKNVAGTAQSEAGKVAQDAKSEARGLLDQATSQVDDQARTQRDRLVDVLGSVGNDMRSMADNSQGGTASDLVRQVATRVQSVGDHLDGREPRQLLEDVKGYARRNPGTFLLGAVAAGVVVGRLTRGARDAQTTTPSTPAANPPSGPPATTPTAASQARAEPLYTGEPTLTPNRPSPGMTDPDDLPGVDTAPTAGGSTLPGGRSR